MSKEIRVYECPKCKLITTISIDLDRADNPTFSRQIADKIYSTCECGSPTIMSVSMEE